LGKCMYCVFSKRPAVICDVRDYPDPLAKNCTTINMDLIITDKILECR
jgi:hypothetical protein